ncbi:hypothetical protein [Stenotrophomonas indicatrix]|uniref:hypothetical protein n=1 Tax=Stenotrophomonas indicatrix TaxID=2045451 RepID=UPI0008BA5318|nr:hypothetical protein [Stenotrophomonas indicatrix]SEU13268.1 hypothetical protein SAMN05720615_11870 [Stenotrophomonas indicatrix]
MSLHTANDISRSAQRNWDNLIPAEPNDEAYQFACDHVAAELESESETAALVATLSQSRAVLVHMMSQEIPSYLRPHLRELADLIRDMRDRVDSQMAVFGRDSEPEGEV